MLVRNVAVFACVFTRRPPRSLTQPCVNKTKPQGFLEQADFLNGVCLITTDLPPQDLLKELKETEKEMGRKKTFKDGPRLIDLDIIYYNDIVLNTPTLTIPHPRAHERLFVMNGILEIAPDFVHPPISFTSFGERRFADSISKASLPPTSTETGKRRSIFCRTVRPAASLPSG